MTSLTKEQVEIILDEAEHAAYEAAGNMYRNNFNSKDGGMCGFAWVTITGFDGYKIKGNTKMGRTMKMAGVKQNYRRSFEVWNPSNFPVQSIDILYEGALAYSKVLKRHGFEADAGSRLD